MKLKTSEATRTAAGAKARMAARQEALERLEWCRSVGWGARVRLEGDMGHGAVSAVLGKRGVVHANANATAGLAHWVRQHERGELSAAELLALIGGQEHGGGLSGGGETPATDVPTGGETPVGGVLGATGGGEETAAEVGGTGAGGEGAAPTTAIERGATAATGNEQLPFTGLPVPLVLMLGAGSLAAGAALRRRTAQR